MSLFFSFYSLTLSLYSLSLSSAAAAVPLLGATYSLPPPSSAATSNFSTAVSSLGLDCVRLDSPDPSAAVRSFLYSNTSLLLSLPNSLVPSLASNRSAASFWLYSSVLPFFPRAKISAISVGHDLLSSSSNLSPFLLPAMRNLRLALLDLGIRKIQVSSTFSFLNTLTSFFPPSSAQFLEPASSNVIVPLLHFLNDTNSSFLVSLYPYDVYRMRGEIPIGYALFQEQRFNFRDDLVTGVRYRNLFDMMVDAVISAMAALGHENVPVVVAETGWPSASGDPTEADANPAYAELYLRGLVRHLRSGIGTPLRKKGVAGAYIYELFDKEELKQQGNRSWGILYPNMTSKYDIDFSGSVRALWGGLLAAKLVWMVSFIFAMLNNGYNFGCFLL